MNAEFLSNAKPALENYISLLDTYKKAYDAYDADYHNPYPESSDYNNAKSKYEDTITNWQSNIEKMFKDLKISDKFNALEIYLSKRFY